eukprot:765425-Amphidinium_carterae.1
MSYMVLQCLIFPGNVEKQSMRFPAVQNAQVTRAHSCSLNFAKNIGVGSPLPARAEKDVDMAVHRQ